MGPRDLEAQKFPLSRRDTGETQLLSSHEIEAQLPALLDQIQHNLLARATEFREKNTYKIDSLEEFQTLFSSGEGFALCHWNGDPEIEKKVKEELNVTIRCIPMDLPSDEGRCLFTGEQSPRRVLFAKAY